MLGHDLDFGDDSHEHYLDEHFDEHYLDDAYVHTAPQQHPLYRRHSVLRRRLRFPRPRQQHFLHWLPRAGPGAAGERCCETGSTCVNGKCCRSGTGVPCDANTPCCPPAFYVNGVCQR